jgi:ComF family protein
LRDWLRGLVELLLPPCCASCGRGVAAERALCERCDARLPRARARGPQLRIPALAACSAAVLYEGEVPAWVRRFKYPRRGWRGLDPAAPCVVRALALEAAREAPAPPPSCVVPIPLHPRRLRERGFNPAALLARAIARERGCRFDASLLRRVRDTPSQTGLDRRARRANVRGAFEVRSGARAPRTIWLVDDVVTTGSTLSEAARTLRRAGAREVIAICAAKTEL